MRPAKLRGCLRLLQLVLGLVGFEVRGEVVFVECSLKNLSAFNVEHISCSPLGKSYRQWARARLIPHGGIDLSVIADPPALEERLFAMREGIRLHYKLNIAAGIDCCLVGKEVCLAIPFMDCVEALWAHSVVRCGNLAKHCFVAHGCAQEDSSVDGLCGPSTPVRERPAGAPDTPSKQPLVSDVGVPEFIRGRW